MTEARSGPEGGFALLIVLWSLALLALLGTRLTSSARTELQLAGNISSSAVLEAQADGLVFDTVFQLLKEGPGMGGINGVDRVVAMPDGRGTVRVTSLAGKVNPNTASEPLMSALLRQIGLAPEAAASLAAAIADWRTPGQLPRPGGAKSPEYRAASLPYLPPGTPFENIDELRQVLGMTPALYARLAPHLTVFYDGDPVWSIADPVVAGALRATTGDNDGALQEGSDVDGVYVQIDANVACAGGQSFTRRAVAWAGHQRSRC